MQDLHKTKVRILNVIRDYNEKIKKKSKAKSETNRRGDEAVDLDEGEEEKDEGGFNAAKYFFVSSRLAKKFPDLRESKIILQFKTPWPRVNYTHMKKDVKNSYNALASSVGRSVAIVFFSLIGHLVNLPVSLQDMIISAVSTAAVGYTVILHISLYEWFPVLVVAPVGIIAIIVHFIVKKNDHDAKVAMAKTSPYYDEPAKDYEERARHKMDEDAHRRSEFEGQGPNLDDPAVVLSGRAMAGMERRRKNPFAHGVDADISSMPLHTSPEDDSVPSLQGESDDEYNVEGEVKIRVKRSSLASIDSVDHFSDVTIASGHAILPATLANQNPDSTVTSTDHKTRRQAVTLGLETLQMLERAQADPDFNPFKGKKGLKYESEIETSDTCSSSSSSSSGSGSGSGSGNKIDDRAPQDDDKTVYASVNEVARSRQGCIQRAVPKTYVLDQASGAHKDKGHVASSVKNIEDGRG